MSRTPSGDRPVLNSVVEREFICTSLDIIELTL
jgi:hypothetical protein